MIRTCRCGDPIMFARVGNSNMPVDVVEQEHPEPGLVAFNPQTEGGQVLTGELCANGKAAEWVAAGATLHKAHWAGCPYAASFRRGSKDPESAG